MKNETEEKLYTVHIENECNCFKKSGFENNLTYKDKADAQQKAKTMECRMNQEFCHTHYFATVDNKDYGAGSKVYHNVVAKIGVYNGNYSDLKIGLPTQSVLLEGEAYHEPVRLLTYMDAPLDTVAKAVENSVAKPFILNEWIRPIIIDKAAKKVYSYEFGEFIVIKELE